jgi:hypothetical protein
VVTRLLLCTSLALVGAVLTQFLGHRYLPLSEVFLWENWDDLGFAGAIGGALMANLCWVALEPSQRISRAMLVCVAANALAWTSFLLFNPPLPDAEFTRIAAERARHDAGSERLQFATDQPIVVAGRWHGTYGSVNRADFVFGFFADPAVQFTEFFVIPPRYIGSDAAKGESYVVAADDERGE